MLPLKVTWKAVLAAAILLLLCTAAAWFMAQDHDALQERVREFLEVARDTPWAVFLVCAIYVVSGAVLFPITVLNISVAMVFGPFWGILYGLAGSLLSAFVYFYFGRFICHRGLHKVTQRPLIRKLDDKICESGTLGITVLRLAPLAPYTVFNIAAGISSVGLATYMTATLLALTPGAIARGLIGDSLMQIFLDPSLETGLYLAGGLALWLAIVVSIHLLLKKYGPDRKRKAGDRAPASQNA